MFDKRDFPIQNILDKKVSGDFRIRMQEAEHEERFALMFYLVDALEEKCHEVIEKRKVFSEIRQILIQFRDEYRRNPEKQNSLQFLEQLYLEQQNEYNYTMQSNKSDEDRLKTYQGVIEHLHHIIQIVRENDSEKKDTLNVVTSDYNSRLASFMQDTANTQKWIGNVMSFVEDISCYDFEIKYLIQIMLIVPDMPCFIVEYQVNDYFEMKDRYEPIYDRNPNQSRQYLFADDDTEVPEWIINNGSLEKCFSKKTELTVPDDVEIIEAGAFIWCRNLINITIPDSVTEIQRSAFYNWPTLKQISYRGLTFSGYSAPYIHEMLEMLDKNIFVGNSSAKHNLIQLAVSDDQIIHVFQIG